MPYPPDMVSEPESGAAAAVPADRQWSQKRGLTPAARGFSCGVAAVFVLLACAFPAFAHEHPKDNLDAHFLDTLERPDNAANPARNMAGTFNSRLCCTDQDAVKVDYEMEVPQGENFLNPSGMCGSIWMARG